MKLLLNFLFFFTLAFHFANGQSNAEHYQTRDYDIAIFPKEYQLHGFEKRFTPTKEEIFLAEEALQTQLKKINKNLPNQSHGPVIHKNLNKYKRQYFGVYDENGKKILLINFFWEDRPNEYWLQSEVQVDDGGSYYWQIKFSVEENQLFDLYINGYA